MSPWRKTFYAAWVGQIFSIMGFSFVLPFLPLYIRTLGVTDDGRVAYLAGVATAAAGLTMALFAPIWGSLADRYGRKPMVLRSMFGGAIVLFLMAYARNVTDLVVLRLLQGVLTGTVTANIALVSSVTPANRSGYTLGMMQAAVFFGGAAGPFIGGEVSEYLGFRAAFLIAAAFVLTGGLLVKFLAREQFEPPVFAEEGGRLKSFREVFAGVGFVAALLTLFQVHFANSAFAPVFPLFVEDLHGSTEGVKALTGRLLGVAGLAAALASGVFGRFSDAWGHKRILMGSMCMAGLVTLPLALARSVPQVYALRILFGLAAAGIMPSANAIIRRIIHERHLGKAYGITASVTCLGWGLGPLAGGYMAKASRNLRGPFVLTGVILLLTTLLVAWRVREVRTPDETETPTAQLSLEQCPVEERV